MVPPSGTGSGSVQYSILPTFNTQSRIGRFDVSAGGAAAGLTITQSGSTVDERRRFVRLLYFSFLGREPSTADLEFQATSSGSNAELAVNFFNTPEFALGGRLIAAIYVALLQRDAEYAGWQFQRGILADSLATQVPLVGNFLNSSEFRLKFGTQDNTEFVRFIFTSILNRSPTPSELAFRLNQLQTGTSRQQMAADFLVTPEFINSNNVRLTAFLLYPTLLLRDSSPAERLALQQNLTSGVALKTFIESLAVSAEAKLNIQ
ncbi:MAG: DUF4214 domain-containing protein [Bryobacteraceae bacterium]|nr:DUF4214 domain-containing protein [Bryobacteraceae bacterium]